MAEAHKAIRDVTLPRIWLEAELIRIAVRGSAPASAAATSGVNQSAAAGTSQPPVKAVVNTSPPAEKKASRVETPPTPKTEAPKVQPHTAPPTGTGPEQVWSATLAELPAGTPISMRLSESRVLSFDGEVLTIGMKRQVDHVWVTDKAQRQAHLVQLVQKHAGAEWNVRFEVDKNGSAPTIVEPEAVELPMDGETLYRAAAEQFKPE